ncbi:MAG: hypothetical protein AAF488_11750, partial [Planctomycetota bacterium]
LTGCFTSRNTFGDGPRGGEITVHRNWYAFWGFVPMGSFDTREVVGPADHYRVTTSIEGFDVFINLFTAPLSFYRQTTIVEK